MTCTPSTRRLLDGVAVRFSDRTTLLVAAAGFSSEWESRAARPGELAPVDEGRRDPGRLALGLLLPRGCLGAKAGRRQGWTPGAARR